MRSSVLVHPQDAGGECVGPYQEGHFKEDKEKKRIKGICMSYQVLARKWRPAVFKDLIGQENVVRILTNALKEKRLYPALIFSGPRGTGKTSTARILSKSLNCPEKTKNFVSCQKCKVCQDIDKSCSLDVLEIDGASHNGVEAVRQLKETVTYLPSAPYKIYIIDEVHMLTTSAFNALLKTLEEPPPHAIFIMATTEMRKIPATVLSRCQILQFHRITDIMIYHHLKKLCEAEKVKTEENALWSLVRFAQGSLRDAQGLFDQMITFCGKSFSSKDISDVLGLTDRSLLLQTLKALLDKNAEEIVKILNQLEETGADSPAFLQTLTKEIRNLILLKIMPNNSTDNSTLIPLSEKEKDIFKEWIQSVSVEDLHVLQDMALKGSWELNRVQDSKVFLEVLLLKMSQAPYVESLFESMPPLKEFQKAKPTREEPQEKTQENSVVKERKSVAEEDSVVRDDKNPFIQQVQTILSADILDSKDS